MLDLTISHTGNLTIKADSDGIEHLQNYRTERDAMALWAELLESHSCNGSFTLIDPATIGALTNSPIIAESAEYDEDGLAVPSGRAWWFPSYAVIDELAMFERGESVTFILAPDAKES